ncbi:MULTISPECIES: ABC transporter ATP-binding protein [unclassified Bilifractor]|uniref:ABC transporter ATP-binding protein n=1 Tax=unclassified Bilifractor TaxID=2815795 RepID=UPI003F93694E
MIELQNLTKKFDDFTAVDHLNLTINTGEFFGLLGSNGAGKTTTISMISTVLLPTEGEILIDGEKVTRKSSAQKRKLSIVTQEYSMRQDMTMDEVMEYQGRLYYMPRKVIRRKTDELLEFAGLIDYRRRIVRHLSGGMKRKLMICRALMTDPGIILLDEPTAGMDAFARRQMWELLRKLQRQNITIILTTHYIEEAEALCDRVAFLHKGKLDVVDTPSNLILSLGKYAVDEATDEGQKSHFFSDRRSAIDYLDGLDPDATASLRRTTLEDAFVERIGNRIRR